MSKASVRAWIPDVLARLAVASGVGYVAMAYTVSRWLTRGCRGHVRTTPADHGLSWERLECVTEDGLRLAGWLVEPAAPRGTVALFHGMRFHRGQMLERIAFLSRAGYRCVTFDHRAHGESGGRRTSFGYYEARDVAAVLKLVRQSWGNEPCAALGLSMGAAALCYASAHTQGLSAIILEGLYHDLASAFRSRIGRNYPAWFRRFTPGVIWVTERRLRLRLAQLQPAEHIGCLGDIPVLLLTGTDDPHAPPEDQERLHTRCRGPKELYLVAGANHRNVCEVGGDAYQQRVWDFLDRQLTAQA